MSPDWMSDMDEEMFDMDTTGSGVSSIEDMIRPKIGSASLGGISGSYRKSSALNEQRQELDQKLSNFINESTKAAMQDIFSARLKAKELADEQLERIRSLPARLASVAAADGSEYSASMYFEWTQTVVDLIVKLKSGITLTEEEMREVNEIYERTV